MDICIPEFTLSLDPFPNSIRPSPPHARCRASFESHRRRHWSWSYSLKVKTPSDRVDTKGPEKVTMIYRSHVGPKCEISRHDNAWDKDH